MNKAFKIIAVNGSHRLEKGISEILLEKVLTGARSAGAHCEVIYPSKMEILSCKACHKCILETPGKCFQKDDMQLIIKKMQDSDLLVLAAPVYFDTMPSDMKRMFERLMPTLGPVFEFRKGRTYHLPVNSKKLNVVTISLCGNPEKKCLESIGATFRRIIDNMEWQLLGEFLFPSSHLAVTHPELLAGQLDALTEAGKESVSGHGISKEIIAAANRDYIEDPSAVIQQMNQIFQDLKDRKGIRP